MNDPATRQLLFKFFQVSAQQLAGYDRATVESYLVSIVDDIFLARAVLGGNWQTPWFTPITAITIVGLMRIIL